MTIQERLDAIAAAIAELKAINQAKRDERAKYHRELIEQERAHE